MLFCSKIVNSLSVWGQDLSLWGVVGITVGFAVVYLLACILISTFAYPRSVTKNSFELRRYVKNNHIGRESAKATLGMAKNVSNEFYSDFVKYRKAKKGKPSDYIFQKNTFNFFLGKLQ